MSNFDWLDYDESPVFKQGIAIVRRYGKFGAVMVGGKEIVPPIYDDLSEFKDGYAVAKWNDEERVVNLSGQIRVLKDNKEIFLPEEYDWGFDFVEDVCVVVKNAKYGIIDFNFNVKHDCEYDSFINYHNGYAIFSKYRWSKLSDNVWSDDFLINNKGIVSYKIEESFADGHKIVCGIDDQDKIYGVMDNNMQIIIPIIYSQINHLKNGLYVADSKDGVKLFIHPSNGNIILERVADYVIDLNKNFFCTFRKDNIQNRSETCIYTSPESLPLCIPSEIYAESDEKENVIFLYRNLKYRYDVDGNLHIIGKKTYYGSESYMYQWDKIIERKVKYDYLEYNHKPFSEKYEIIEDDQKKKGLSDLEGNTVISPQYMEIYSFTEEMFIVSMLPANGTSQRFGVVDFFNNIKIPLTFNYLIPINDKFLAYTDNELNIRENYKLSLPSSFTYENIRFGIIDIRGKKITKPIFSQITINIDNTVFIIREDSGIGLIDCKGQYILNPKYNNITYNEQNCTFTTSIQYREPGNYPIETKTNKVSLDGCYIVKNHVGEIVKVPSQIVDWCGDFSENDTAIVIKYGYSGHINALYQFVSFINDTKMIMPTKYSFIRDFTYGYAPVSLNGKFGIINDNFKLVIPCEYEYIEPLSENIFKFKKENNWGVIDKYMQVVAEADYINITYETENLFKVASRVPNGSSSETRYGFLDRQGKVIVPVQCKTIKRIEQENNIFFIAEMNWNKGVLDKDGNIIVPFIYSKISQEGRLFYCYSGNISSVYNSVGEHMLYISDKQYVIIPTEYEYAQYAGYGLIQVSKAGKWGLIDTSGQVIVETKFTCIDKFDGSFAIVGISSDDKKMEYGLIDTSGETVLSIEYEDIEKWDNDYYAIRKNGLYGLLSPTLHMSIEPSKEYLKKLNEKYVFVKEHSEFSTAYMNGLIDYYGNEIIPAYKNFSEVIVLENGFLKVIYNKSQYKGCSHIGILNVKGQEVYSNNECDDITYIANGLLLVKGHIGYNIASLQGKELFDNYYDYIEILENGNFLIYKNNCCGMAKSTGEIFIQPQYKGQIKFENGIAEVKINENKSSHKINEDGQVIVLDEDKNEVIIPKDYYWGTDFINGISIVRDIKNNKLGVINKQGDALIVPEFDTIDLMLDKTLLVAKYNYHREKYYYGLYDINGKCIFPAIFKDFEYLNKNRIRIVWNLDETQSWSFGEYTPGPNKYLGDGAEYCVNNRSALCDTKGNIISSKNLVCVQKFKNAYACSSLALYIKENQVYLKHVGIININGQTIVPPEYDKITLYDHSFALLRKGEKYGIADLKNRKTILFNDINIKGPGVIDSYGRFIYTDGDCNNQTNNKGVIGPKGIIISSGKYSNIELLDNGLIKVSNEENTLFGLLNSNGKELLKMEYSYISSFRYGYATVCIGGHYEEDNFTCELVEGKWGIIDKTGKFIVKCIHNEKYKLSAEDIIKYNLIDDSEFDSYGRVLFHEWKEINRCNIGVIGRNGIIVPTGKYPNIQLLENGLIKVSNKEETFDSLGGLYGLLDADGKELLEMKYSYISGFKNGHASICIGGYNTHLMQNTHVGGKWGIIDITGKIIVECIHDEEQQLTIENIVEKYLMDEYGNKILQVLCSDCIPVDASSNIGYDYSDNNGDYDDSPYIDDSPYYNDNLDMDQQSIEFWNSF